MIDILHDQPWQGLPDDGALRRAVAAAAEAACGRPIDGDGLDLCLRLADDQAVAALNRRWRGVDQATDVLAFPQQEGAIDPAAPLGDIIVAVPFLRREAARLGLPPADHLIHLVVHATLHLFGHDHAEAEETRRMRLLENHIMQRLALHTPWPEAAQ